ncbi:MAG: hypothetical protein E7017_05310 [Alphaproteobacteria bacterium]|nr:hypothetical protein [Alphaproteobacteria bacterium]
MPQLDFSVFPSQLFWLVVNFFLMLFIMVVFIIPRTAEMINLRKQKIEGDLEKAAEIKRKVEKTLDKYNKALQEATAKANVSLAKTRDELNETINRRQNDLSNRLQSEIAEGEKKIADAKKKAMDKLEDSSAELVVDVLEKLGFTGIKIKDAKVALKAVKEEN